MIELIKRIVRWDDVINAVSNLLPHINRLVLGTLSIVALTIVAIFLILFT